MKQPDRKLKVLVVGSGGREHVLASLCSQSPFCRETIVAPGNGGMARQFSCFPVAADDIAGLTQLAVDQNVDFVVVGPEVPLSLGLVDSLAEKGISAFGPKTDGARLEASKIFTKNLLLKHNIPTAAACDFDEVGPALEYLRDRDFPIVVKADGLAAGKGVIVAADFAEAEKAVVDMLEGGAFGTSGRQILIEDCLFGEELSIHLVVSGRDFVILPTSQDHKRIGENDTGPNTGGMGAYSPADLLTGDVLRAIEEQIAKPSVEAIAAEGIHFTGALFIGIMLTPDGPKVLEYNTRFGDPETQVILPRLETDLLHLLHASANGYLPEIELKIKSDYALCVVLTAGGYPGNYAKGDVIDFPAEIPADSVVYHAGTATGPDGKIVTNGGRVLGVTATAPTLSEASRAAYELAGKIKFASMYYRRDIGAKQLNR